MIDWANNTMEMIIFIGLQGSGKSIFYQKHFANTHLRLNLDMLRTRRRERAILEACLQSGQRFVVDNTNPNLEDRQRYLKLADAAHFQCVAYFFDVPLETCIERNGARLGKRRIPEKGLRATERKLSMPLFEEGFSKIYRVDSEANANLVWDQNEV